jgi:hypothetical protein
MTLAAGKPVGGTLRHNLRAFRARARCIHYSSGGRRPRHPVVVAPG